MRSPFQFREVPTSRIMFAFIFVAGIALKISVVTLLYLSLDVISTRTNDIDAQRTAFSVVGAVKTSVNKMSALVMDNSVWDDAVRHTYSPTLNHTWLYETWGSRFKNYELYDGVFLLDQNFHLIWGAQKGEIVEKSDTGFLGKGFAIMVSQHRADLTAGNAIYSGITRTSSGTAFIGIGLIRPMAGKLHVPGNLRRYIVMTRHMSAPALNELGSTFQINNLHFTHNATVNASIPLRSYAGESLGYLSWTPRFPGEEAAKAASGEFTRIVILESGLILLFIAISCLAVLKLARSEKQAHAVALTDGLSQLPNRRALIERLNKISNKGASGEICVVFIDLDGFKDVNDTYGHDTGDQLIVTVADRLRELVPPEGMLARMGGDEFALLTEGPYALPQSDKFARRVLSFMSLPVFTGESTLNISASMGIATGTLFTCSISELFRRADIAMYYSKMNGKGRITHYNSALSQARDDQLNIEKGIREGLANKEFDVWYQPIVDASNLSVIAVEALLRWPRRPQGALLPDEFIRVAENSRLIHALGEFVLERACTDLLGLGHLKLSVNISPAQFMDPEFERKVDFILNQTHFPAHRLEFEVTETHIIEDPEHATSAIAALKLLGASVALDDFGTGCSSIGYLRRFKFDTIKIDKSLAGRIDTDSEAKALVKGTVYIATSLGMAVTAEGVENDSQVNLLQLAGCNYLQGYLFCPPVPFDELSQWLRTELI